MTCPGCGFECEVVGTLDDSHIAHLVMGVHVSRCPWVADAVDDALDRMLPDGA